MFNYVGGLKVSLTWLSFCQNLSENFPNKHQSNTSGPSGIIVCPYMFVHYINKNKVWLEMFSVEKFHFSAVLVFKLDMSVLKLTITLFDAYFVNAYLW